MCPQPIPEFIKLPNASEWWIAEQYFAEDIGQSICIYVTAEFGPPTAVELMRITTLLGQMRPLVLLASKEILNNYSFEYFRSRGVPAEQLIEEESPSRLASRLNLISIWFNDYSGESFEMSFSLPWDSHHSYDVEFEGGVPVLCSVNG